MAGPPPPTHSGPTARGRSHGAPVRGIQRTETGSAVVLLGAVVVARVWANSPWPDSYESFWHTVLAIRVGDHGIATGLREWVNQGLMTLFFLVVGLEAKRELDLGELRERSRIAIPVMAALGGMLAAVGLYLLINQGGDGASGWGVAMSTDTALALGVLALTAPKGATRLRVFLLTMVVVDDVGALLVIAFAYTDSVDMTALLVAVGLFAVLVLLRFAPRFRGTAAAVVGVAIWVAMYESGVDPVIAGLAIGLITSAYPPERGSLERATELTREFREQPTPELAVTAQRSLGAAISPNERLQHRLHPWTSYVIVPVFALANAGIHLDSALLSDAAASAITIGIVVAYVVGKPLGIFVAAWLGTRPKEARLTVTWPGLVGTGAAAGVGFTVSLLIASLAFEGAALDEAKLGILATIVLSPLVAWTAFAVLKHLPEQVLARQLHRTADQLIDLADEVDERRDHVRGAPDAPVTIVEYADFECPYCGQAEPTIRELLAGEERDELRYVFRHLPLTDVHPNATMAAEAAEAAGAQGMFWEMHDRLFEHQDTLAPKDLRRHAEALGLDVERFAEDLRTRAWAPRVREDVQSADESGVSGTPSFFVNGRRHHGVYDIAALKQAVRQARLLAVADATA